MSLSPFYRRFAWLLDECFRIPGTKLRFGLDSIVGLIPGVGDFVMAAGSLWLVVEGIRLGLPFSVHLRMLLNILIEVVIGAIPVLGDVFDFFWKANLKNAALIDAYLKAPVRVDRQSKFQLGIVLVLVLLFLNLLVIGIFLAFRWVINFITG